MKVHVNSHWFLTNFPHIELIPVYTLRISARGGWDGITDFDQFWAENEDHIRSLLGVQELPKWLEQPPDGFRSEVVNGLIVECYPTHWEISE